LSYAGQNFNIFLSNYIVDLLNYFCNLCWSGTGKPLSALPALPLRGRALQVQL